MLKTTLMMNIRKTVVNDEKALAERHAYRNLVVTSYTMGRYGVYVWYDTPNDNEDCDSNGARDEGRGEKMHSKYFIVGFLFSTGEGSWHTISSRRRQRT